jgi:hypothetical protein
LPNKYTATIKEEKARAVDCNNKYALGKTPDNKGSLKRDMNGATGFNSINHEIDPNISSFLYKIGVRKNNPCSPITIMY